MQSGIYVDKEGDEIIILTGGNIRVKTVAGIARLNDETKELPALVLGYLKDSYEIGTNLNDKEAEELPLKIKLVFQDARSINIILKCLMHIKEYFKFR